MAIPALCSELVRCRACWRHTKTRQRSRRSDFANLRFKAHLQSVADGVAESSRTTGCDRAWTRRKDQNARPVRGQCLRFRIAKGHIRCQYHRFGDPGNGTGVILTQHGWFRGCLPDRPHRLDASRCSLDTVLDQRTYARTMSLIRETSEDCEQQTARAEPHSHGALSERTWPAVVTSRSGNESRSNTPASGVVARESAYSIAGGRTKSRFRRVAATASASFKLSRSLTAWFNNARALPASPRHRARLPSSCSAQASADRSPIALAAVEAAFQGDSPGAPSRTGDQRLLEKPAQLKNLSRAPGIGSVLLHAQQRFGFHAARCPDCAGGVRPMR